ncbi:glycosyltransferase [Sulfitobacter sp. G21635-S1]|uniref:glycosyltransferase n=1 Tax=Sulfitobacter sp. G21635-S1 TaxID=3014043 RepID=UPI0022AFA657|nr:glycosyltransferase [Sulfitobacter sp. G21635-S1]MCZ4255762.1 glycosyltransferase [Sulfitobacter sp. G21635-S1]
MTRLPATRPLMGDVALLQSSPYFDEFWYLDQFPDAVDCGLAPAEHYLWVGAVMGRDPSPYFSGQFYLEQNPEVAAAKMNPLVHYLRHGHAEGRRAHPDDVALPIPQNRPGHDVLGPAPWGDALRNSPLQTTLQGDGPAELPSPEARAIAGAVLSGCAQIPTVSVVLPIHGRGFFRALDSALGQSVAPAEIILVYSAGQDETLTQVRRTYTEAISSGLLRILPSIGTGYALACNTALEAARGELIAYLDGDCHWRQDYLKLMTAWFAQNDDLATGYAGWRRGMIRPGKPQAWGTPYDRAALLQEQTIDLSTYMHRRSVSDQLGGFDEDLGCCAAWDLILRQTAVYAPGYLGFVGADVVRDLTETGSEHARHDTQARHRQDRWRHGLEAPRIAYVLWDWPALSQSFVMAELEWLVSRGFDVEVFFKIAPDRAAEVPFDIKQHQVETPEELAKLLILRDRTLVHCHFAYPAMTLLTWPACQLAGIPFTFFGHAVDIFLHNNIAVNRIAEIMNDPLCLKLFVHGDYHRKHLETQDIPVEKLAYAFQSANLDLFRGIPDKPAPVRGAVARGVFIGRFTEKKGIETLIEAAALLRDEAVAFDVYGYGPLWGIIHEQAKSLGVDNITFHGPLDGRYAVRDILQDCDFCIVPSIVADTGDTEGFPTVVMEAMAARRPVVTTAVSAMQDYLTDGIHAHIAAPRDPQALANAVRRMLHQPAVKRRAMLQNGADFLRDHVGTDRTMQTYCDTWYRATLDIVLVTYNTPEHDDFEQTIEIIRRIRSNTTTPYRLVVIDNGSDRAFRAALTQLARQMPNMRLHFLDRNRLVGPATNIALAGSDAVYAIYLCSKEGFVARHGWERPLIDHMREHPDVSLGGNLCHLPPHTLGREIVQHPAFPNFRNPEFAKSHPDRPFQHVQGGAFILRRDVVDRETGFSSSLPQASTDVEFSYFLESRGHKLANIPQVSSLTVKTLPRLDAVLDEATAVAHPVLPHDTYQLDRMQIPTTTRCNLCQGWDCIQDDGRCSHCQSSGMDRKLYQFLAHDWRAHRGNKALLVDCVASLVDALGTSMFDPTATSWQDLPQSESFTLICLGSEPGHDMAKRLLARLEPGGLMVWPEGSGAAPAALVNTTPGLRASIAQRVSRVLRSDSRRLFWVARNG